MYNIFSCPIYIKEIILPEEEIIELKNDIESLNLKKPKTWLADINTSFDDHDRLHLDPSFGLLASCLNEHAITFAKELNFKFSEFNIEMAYMWANVYEKNQSQEKHSHGTSFISCSYMLDAPEDTSTFVFFNPLHEGLVSYPIENDELSSGLNGKNMVEIKSKTGKLIMFPGWLEHGVRANPVDHKRITFSSNWHIVNKHE